MTTPNSGSRRGITRGSVDAVKIARKAPLAIAVGATILVAFGAEVPAHADTDGTDGAFLAALHARDITSKEGDQGLVSLAHGICDMLATGYSVPGIEAKLEPHKQNGITDSDTKFIVVTSVGTYCPEYIQ